MLHVCHPISLPHESLFVPLPRLVSVLPIPSQQGPCHECDLSLLALALVTWLLPDS
jgi:hypothetical protein